MTELLLGARFYSGVADNGFVWRTKNRILNATKVALGWLLPGSLERDWEKIEVNGTRPLPLALLLLVAAAGAHAATEEQSVLRARLDNGLRVVIIRNSWPPVSTVEMNVLVGGDETPAGFPGMAHAQEHMAFRGFTGMTGDQTGAIYAQLGGRNNADTQQTITQFFTTVPSLPPDAEERGVAVKHALR
jgi:hypothetical protein